MRFDEPTLARLRGHLMKRGQQLATMLSDLLAGKAKESDLERAGINLKPGLRPEEALRLTLDAVEARRKLIDADDDRYGRCDVCGEDLGLTSLEEMPWADRCQKHRGD